MLRLLLLSLASATAGASAATLALDAFEQGWDGVSGAGVTQAPPVTGDRAGKVPGMADAAVFTISGARAAGDGGLFAVAPSADPIAPAADAIAPATDAIAPSAGALAPGETLPDPTLALETSLALLASIDAQQLLDASSDAQQLLATSSGTQALDPGRLAYAQSIVVAASVPEPATLALVAAGVLLLVSLRPRRS